MSFFNKFGDISSKNMSQNDEEMRKIAKAKEIVESEEKKEEEEIQAKK